MPTFNSIKITNKNKEVVVATNGKLPSLDGSLLKNLPIETTSMGTGFNICGVYDPESTYQKTEKIMDVVQYNGSLWGYTNLEPGSGNAPPANSMIVSNDYWTLLVAKGEDGKDGTTFIPSVNIEGDLSWTNDGGKENPETINIKGPQGVNGNSAVSWAVFTAVTDENSFTGTAQIIKNDGTLGEIVNVVYGFEV